MARLVYLTHPQVRVDPDVPVPQWGLNPQGRARAERLAAAGCLAGVSRIVSSGEVKAIETAQILAGPLGLTPEVYQDLGENDRSATGFLPSQAFEATADRFFAEPTQSADGWERAIDAQARVVRRTAGLAKTQTEGDLLICGHGAVGTLLYCHLAQIAITRTHDQITGGGCFFAAPLPHGAPLHGWRPMEQMLDA